MQHDPARSFAKPGPLPWRGSRRPDDTRRGLLGFSLAALTAGLTVPAVAATANPDAELAAACEEAQRWEVERVRGNERGMSDDECDAINDAWIAAFQRVADLPATTPAGLRAKAAALRTAVMEFVIIGPDFDMDYGDQHDRFAVALCDDILSMLGGVA
jgi:hypothetical protein